MKLRYFAAIVVSAALVAACDRETASQKVDEAVKTAGSAADKAGEAVSAAADKAKEVAAEGFDAIKGQVEELYNQAMSLVNEKKFTDAKAVADKLMTWKDKLPADWQTKVADLVKKIEDGIKAMGGN
ncbi:MAG: hypothetical protein NZ561_06980 [Phycisphaerae bacterium]|nr:hypothetical protein [Phycisphaerae bacterium]MDW8263153.1 hypothetical protein [Phycisphaerales bacterium]